MGDVWKPRGWTRRARRRERRQEGTRGDVGVNGGARGTGRAKAAEGECRELLPADLRDDDSIKNSSRHLLSASRAEKRGVPRTPRSGRTLGAAGPTWGWTAPAERAEAPPLGGYAQRACRLRPESGVPHGMGTVTTSLPLCLLLTFSVSLVSPLRSSGWPLHASYDWNGADPEQMQPKQIPS